MASITYTYAHDLTKNRDLVRFYLKDTDVSGNATTALLSDQEINGLLTITDGNALKAAIMAGESLIAQFSSRKVEERRVGDLMIKYGDLANKYQSVVANLRRRLALSASPTAGGISERPAETILEGPLFTRDLHDGLRRPD